MSASSALHEHAEGVHRNGSRPGPHDSQSWAQRVDRRHECVVVRVEGELDAVACPDFFATVEQAVRSNCHAVVIDLRAARFLSLRAASTLGAVKQRAACEGTDVRIVAGRQAIERSLEVSGVRPLFSPYPSMRAALDA
ncbi:MULTISPECIES: STAS domain-containing protein [Nocardia]|uniref:STAS domain-containing protein n=2 Tax=Nocardia iowensis TaxID=204891 RepID=A0ABX8RKF9_NOCIO|nr:STAS domain-containing protein [Nocardia iowensis]QXN88920.1 STAS domain-containing protein [Nocardia iowensis]